MTKFEYIYLKAYFKLRKFLIYAMRWQLSTPIYAIIIWLLSGMNPVVMTIIANAIGACIFYWVDKAIFSKIK